MSETAGQMIKAGRCRAGLSQTELARRAGVSQPVISAYERDRREPGFEMLRKLIEASGHQLTITLTPSPGARPGLPDTPMGRRLRRHRRAVIDAAARRGAGNVRVFGSIARGEDTPSSDVDLLVDLDEGVGLVALIALEQDLAALLGADVDLVPASSLKPALRDEVLAQAIPL